jgi:hypothetical protein
VTRVFSKRGGLYRALDKSSVITTDPWSLTHRTITTFDHKRIEPPTIALLIEHHDMNDAGIWVWLLEEQVVWQIMKYELFVKHWEAIDLENVRRRRPA